MGICNVGSFFSNYSFIELLMVILLSEREKMSVGKKVTVTQQNEKNTLDPCWEQRDVRVYSNIKQCALFFCFSEIK